MWPAGQHMPGMPEVLVYPKEEGAAGAARREKNNFLLLSSEESIQIKHFLKN